MPSNNAPQDRSLVGVTVGPSGPHRRLFVAQLVHVWEAQWFAPGVSYHHPASDGVATPERSERRYSIMVTMFPAADEDAAYQQAMDEVANESDVNFDGPSHRNVYYMLGIHQLEEYPSAEHFNDDLDRRGVWIASVHPSEVDSAGAPRVRAKEELEIFRLKRAP